MIKSIDEIMAALKEKLPDTDDTTLGLLEDITDTLNDFSTKASDTTNWQEKYNNLEKDWREKYKARFFSAGDENEKTSNVEPALSPIMEDRELTFEKLFKQGDK